MIESLPVIYEDESVAVISSGNLVVSVAAGAIVPDQMNKLLESFAAIKKAKGQAYGMTISVPDLVEMLPQTREVLVRALKANREMVARHAFVLAGEGLKVSAMRAAITLTLLVSQPKFQGKTFTRTIDALNWLCADGGANCGTDVALLAAQLDTKLKTLRSKEDTSRPLRAKAR